MIVTSERSEVRVTIELGELEASWLAMAVGKISNPHGFAHGAFMSRLHHEISAALLAHRVDVPCGTHFAVEEGNYRAVAAPEVTP